MRRSETKSPTGTNFGTSTNWYPGTGTGTPVPPPKGGGGTVGTGTTKYGGAGTGTDITFRLPLRVVSEANAREHWATKARRAKGQRGAALLAVRAHASSIVATMGAPSRPRLVVTLTRIGVRALDSDNLARAFKAVRDGIADAIGIDDGDKRIDWRYAQRRGGVREYAVDIRMEVV